MPKPHHVVFCVGAAFVLASPFFALVRGDAGWLAFAVGMLTVFLAAHAAPDDDRKED